MYLIQIHLFILLSASVYSFLAWTERYKIKSPNTFVYFCCDHPVETRWPPPHTHTPKTFVQILILVNTTHAPRGYEKVYSSHDEAFLREQGRIPSRSKCVLGERKKRLAWFLMWLGNEIGKSWGLHSSRVPSVPKERAPGFLTGLGQKWKGEWETWKLSGIKYQKWSQTFYYNFLLNVLFFGSKCFDAVLFGVWRFRTIRFSVWVVAFAI